MVDVDGNSVIFIREDAPDDYDEAASDNQSHTRFGKALRLAARLRDFKNDDVAAGKVLDSALNEEAGDPFERARLLAARAEIAVALGDRQRAQQARAEISALPLSAEQRARLGAELKAIQTFKRSV
jgi:hypothetical protein